ncbi:MAG: histidinol-phosphatase HisJ family protein [Anaerotignaceae bacterium]
MFFADYHTHTSFSSDCSEVMENNITKAIECGLKEIAITDHIDYDYPDLNYPFLFDYEPYSKEIKRLQEKYSKLITILIGVEIGIQPHIYPTINDLINTNYYDFIIGSTHTLDKTELCVPSYFENKTKSQAYRAYFEEVLKNVKEFPFFNVYGHLDFVNRYGNYTDKTMDYYEFKDITDEILKELIAKGKGIEINTSGFRYGLGHTHPQLTLVKRFKELGGEIITVGSDAHICSDITKDFSTAYDMLRECGFKYITTFNNKTPNFVKF